MKSLKTMPKLVLAGGIAMSSLSMIPLNTGAESVPTTQNASQQSSYSVMFTEANHNQTVSIKKGQTFAIQLPALPLYFGSPSWSLDHLNKNISFMKEDVQDAIPGSTGKRVYVFKATSTGTTKIQFRHKSDWAGQPPYTSEPKFVLTVNVTN
ncbi:protease inhibitor I42 family protein [Bacillus thuringiensis]